MTRLRYRVRLVQYEHTMMQILVGIDQRLLARTRQRETGFLRQKAECALNGVALAPTGRPRRRI